MDKNISSPIIIQHGLTLPKIVLLILFSYTCNNDSTKKIDDTTAKNSVFTIDIEKYFDDVISIPVSYIASKIEYVPLETKPECLLESINQMMPTDSFIFICNLKGVYKFDRKGNYKLKIGRIGKGPGEYTMALGFCIDEINAKIYIRDYGSEIDVFDFNGVYIRSWKAAFSTRFLCIDGNKIVFGVPDIPTNYDPIDISLFITDTTGNILHSFKNHHKRTSKQGIMFSTIPIYTFKNKLKTKEYGSDTIYIVEDYIFKPYAIFRLGKHAVQVDPDYSLPNAGEIMKEFNSKLIVWEVKESNEYLYITLRQGADVEKNCVFNKSECMLMFLQDNKFENNLDGGPDLWPKVIYHDSIYIDYLQAYDFKSLVLNKQSLSTTKEIKNMAQNIKEDANPIIVLFSR